MAKKKKAAADESVAQQATEDTKEIGSVEERIAKEFGEVLVGANYIVETPRVIVPVSPAFDCMLGGGIPFGSFVIPTGPPKVGKTSFSLDMAGTALGIPTEFDIPRHLYFMNIEGRLNSRDLMGIHHLAQYVRDKRVTVVSSRPGKILTAENYLDIAERFINEKPGSIFIFDSFSQLSSQQGQQKEWDGKVYRDNVPGLLSQFCKRISNVIPINKCIVVGVTHQYSNTSGFGAPWSEGSGNKVQYQVDVKLKAPKATPWKAGETKIGQSVEWECFCSPLLNGPVEESCTSKLRYGYGLDKPAELVDLCVDLRLITKNTNWYNFPDGRKANGIDQAGQLLRSDETMYRDLHDKFRDMMGLPSVSFRS